MSVDQIVSVSSAAIAFVGLLLVVLQLREGNKQHELTSLVEIYDINRELITLGFSYPQLFEILNDAKGSEPTWERRYLQLWLNQFSLIHSYLRRSVFDAELEASLERELVDFMRMENMQRHWKQHGSFFPTSFQKLVNDCIHKAAQLSADSIASGD